MTDAIDRRTLKLKRDWVGLRVRLLISLRTRGGAVFRRGSVLIVSRNRGGLHLSRLHPGKDGMWQGRCIRCVHERSVEIIGREPEEKKS